MTNKELLNSLLAENLQEVGEDAFSTRMLRTELWMMKILVTLQLRQMVIARCC